DCRRAEVATSGPRRLNLQRCLARAARCRRWRTPCRTCSGERLVEAAAGAGRSGGGGYRSYRTLVGKSVLRCGRRGEPGLAERARETDHGLGFGFGRRCEQGERGGAASRAG